MRRNEEFNYARQLTQANDAGNDEAMKALAGIGPPPYTDLLKIKTLRDWADRLATGTGDPVEPIRPRSCLQALRVADVETFDARILSIPAASCLQK